MKHVKNFFKKEKILKFKNYDLVVPTKKFDDKLNNYLNKNYGQISHVYKNGLCEIIYTDVPQNIVDLMYKSDGGFHRIFNGKTDKLDMLVIFDQDEIRRLMSDELENYLIKKQASIYNI